MIKVYIGNNLHREAHIIDENTTLRAALEEAEIDYSSGTPSLDGTTLAPGDLDKTFADFGITEKCYLLVVVKLDNAADVKIVGNACVIESGVSLEDIKVLQKFRPKMLRLYETVDNKREEVFCVGVTKTGNGSISECGASFSPTPAANGKAAITLIIPEGVDDPVMWATETIGVSILKLRKVETQFADAMADVEAERAEVAAAIHLA